jgi:hypothetical protein
MKFLFKILALLTVLNARGQCDDLVNWKLKATYICCTSSPNDTSFISQYYYNKNQTLDRIENFKKNELRDIIQFVYDSSGTAIKRLVIYPYTLSQFCGDKIDENCLSKIMQLSFRHDSIADIYYVIHDEKIITKPKTDSIFRDSKLVTVLSGTDTLHTYLYDKHNRLVKRYNYSICSKKLSSWTEFQYLENITIENTFSMKNKKKPSIVTELIYNEDKQVIKKTRTYRFPGRKQPMNNHIIEKYKYNGDKIIVYESYDNYIDPCYNIYCCGRYKKYYVYKE